MASFIENFNSLDASFWIVSDNYANLDPIFNATWRAANTTVDPVTGLLSISVSPDPHSIPTKVYAAGEIKSVAFYGYGIFSVRMRAAPEPGVITAFFLYVGNTDGQDEIDIELGFFGDHSHAMLQVNFFTNGVGGHEQVIELGFDASADFHTYTVLWAPGSLTWLVDGVQVAFASGNTPTVPGQIFMNCWPTTGNDTWAGRYSGNPTAAVYDWVQYTAQGEDLIIGAASFSSNFTAVIRQGGTLVGTATITNYGASDVTLPAVKISSTDPSGNPVDFGSSTEVIVPVGQAITVTMPRTFSLSDPAGVWQGFFAYQGDDGSWITGNPFVFYVI